MNRVTTPTQRRDVLAQIDRAERRMLPPGWDTGLETQFGSTLTDHHGADPIDLAQAHAQKYPKHTSCREYIAECAANATTLADIERWEAAELEHARVRAFRAMATQALGQQRRPMPGEPEPTRDLRHIAARAVLGYFAVVAACAAALIVRACA